MTTLELTVGKRFEDLDSEDFEREESLEVKMNPVVKEMLEGFEKGIEEINGLHYEKRSSSLEAYKIFEQHIPATYTANDITLCSIAINKYQNKEQFNKRAGLYLSALINHCKEKDITLQTPTPLSFLGYQNNGKNITIIGDTGFRTGFFMNSGTITVHGNARDETGACLKGGVLNVQGDTGDYTGMYMNVGTINVAGKTGKATGYDMGSGTINVGGKQIISI